MLSLKRLDITGFKSFAGKTSFHFSESITAIVGPNGSGKSNVSDALRWVLGGQSGRLIRTRKTEDVLFAGSAKRQAAERAEVTITLDNSTGWLPTDAPEVTFGRRAQRNGESEYFINRRKVRLRDVQDLLTAATAGQTSYSIIGQGLVESVLNLRPEERRQLIEEAADIQRYRSRIESAQEKLAATHENMARIDLLIQEITPRLRQLERQAKRADQHQHLSQELRQALQAWYEHMWEQATEALAMSGAAHDQAQADYTQARVALETCQRELSAISEDLEPRRTGLAGLLAQRQHLTEQVRGLEQHQQLDQQRRSILQTRQQELSEELDALQVEHDRAASSVYDDGERRQQIEGDIETARIDLQAHRQALSDLDTEFQGAQAKAGAAEEKAGRLGAAALDLKTRADRLTHGSQERETSRLRNRRRSLVNQLAETVRVLRSLTEQGDETRREAEELVRQRQGVQNDLRQLHKIISNLQANQQARTAKLEGLRARLEVIQEANAQFGEMAEYDPEGQSIMVEGLLASVHQVIRVPRGMEKAIESALSDYMEALIVENHRDALNAVQSIADSGVEHTYVMPLQGFKTTYPLNILKEKGIVGVASKLVKCEPGYQPIVDALLGRTVIAQDIATAARVARRGLGTVVTLDGIVFHPLGSVSAGVPRTPRPTFALSYDRDIEALPRDIERTERALDVTGRELENRRDEEREGEHILRELDEKREANSQKQAHVQQSAAERRQVLGHLRGELRGVMSALQRMQEQDESFAAEAASLLLERERLLAEATEAVQTADYLRRAINMVDSQREGILQSITEVSTRIASLEGELRSLVDVRQQSEATVQRIATQLDAKQMQLKGLEIEISALAAGLLTAEQELAEAQSSLHQCERETQPEQETIAQSEARERELRSQLMTLQNRLLQGERRVLETEAETHRWETELSTLRQHIQDDGLTIGDHGDVRATETPHIPFWLASTAEAAGTDDQPRPIAGSALIDPQQLGVDIDKLRAQIRQLGPVNMEAQTDYHDLEERHEFLSGQLADLRQADESLQIAIAELDGLIGKRLEATFEQVSTAFADYFRTFFGGGDARLVLTRGPNSGVDIVARPTSKRVKSLSQLSGGEKALTAVSFLFALLQTNPSPFCVLDEVDAMLDEANVERFVGALQKLSDQTQFIVISHNRKTIEKADCIYGVSMGPDNASKVLSLRLSEIRN